MPTEPERVRVGADAPDFTLTSPGRGRIRLADYRGREQVLLVFMRAFGWPFCRRHLAQLRERYDEIRGTGVEVLALAPGSLDQTDAFAAARGIPFPLLADPQRDVYRAYEVESRLLSLGRRPALFAIDLGGVVRYAFLGTQQWQLGDIDEALAALATSP